MTSFKLEVRKELLDRYNQVLDIAAEYGYNPSSYGVRGDVIKSIHAMFTDKQNDNVRAFALRVKNQRFCTCNIRSWIKDT